MASFVDAATSLTNLWSARRIAVEVESPDGRCVHVLVDKPFARVGRDQRSEVPLSDAGLLPCHLYLHATDEGVYCVGLCGDAPGGWLTPSESVQIGPFLLRARLADANPIRPSPDDLQAKQSDLARVPQVRVFSGGRQARSTDLRLRRRLTLLGRESPATRRVNHPTISRVHGAFFFDGRELWLVDLFSSNGTRLAGNRFDSGRLQPGQELKLGSVRFRYLGTGMADEGRIKISAPEEPAGVHESQLSGIDESVSALAGTGGGQDERCLLLEQRFESLREQGARQLQEMERRLRKGRRGYRKRLAAVKHEFATQLAGLRDEVRNALQDRRSAETGMASMQPAPAAGQADGTESLAGPLSEALKLPDEALLRIGAQYDTVRQFQTQQQAQSVEVGTIREELLADLADLREQIAVLRRELETQAARLSQWKQTVAAVQPTLSRLQSGDCLADAQRHWREDLQSAIHEVQQRIADVDRQASLGSQAASDRLAVLEGALTARIADLQAALNRLREMADQRPSAFCATPVGGDVLPGPSDAQAPAQSPPSPSSPGQTTAGPDSPPPPQPFKDDEGLTPAQWIFDDEVIGRLVDFKTSHDEVVRRRRLLCTAVAAGLMVILASGAGIIHHWLGRDPATKASEAAALEETRLANP